MLVLKGNGASIEVFLDRVEISQKADELRHELSTGEIETIYFKDVRCISVREVGIFKSGFIEFATLTQKRAIAFDYADLNSRAVSIQSFVLKQMQKVWS